MLDKKILKSMMKFCSYHERSEQEVSKKINLLLMTNNNELDQKQIQHIEDYILELKNNNFLNTNRFLESYIKGKVNIKKWGRNRIIVSLKKHKLKVNNLDQYIDLEIYTKNLQYLAEKKMEVLKLDKKKHLKELLHGYLVNKGYTIDEIESVSVNY